MSTRLPHAAARAVAAAGAAVLTLCACAATSGAGHHPGSTSPAGPVNAGPATPWTTYHGNAARTGFAAGLPAAGPLAIAWSRPLDGTVYGQPLVVGNRVIAATENDSIYALDRASGRIEWRRHLAAALPLSAQPCGLIDPLGITSTPVLYGGIVYALAQDGRSRHVLFGLDPADGRVRSRQEVPSPDGQPYFDQQRGALTAEKGRIYIVFGGHFGDCGPYVGSVVGMPARPGRAASPAIVSYRVPTGTRAGIWASGGPAISRSGTLFVGVGNGATSGAFDGSDSVTALSPGLHRTAFFAPASWIADNSGDLDLGSMTPAITSAGQILMAGKRGTGYLLNLSRLGGVGGQLDRLPLCPAFGAAAVFRSLVVVPCSQGGPAAVAVPPRRLKVLWRGPATANGSPVIGGGAVWVTDWNAGVLYELSIATGQVRHQLRLGAALPHFESPSLSGRLLLIGTMNGVVAVSGA
jgi:outer membrane protein assembly factor BamB